MGWDKGEIQVGEETVKGTAHETGVCKDSAQPSSQCSGRVRALTRSLTVN